MKEARLARGVGGLLAFLALWEAGVRAGVRGLEYLPPPSDIATALVRLVQTPALIQEMAHTIGAALISWITAIVIGVVAGSALGLSAALRAWAMPSIELLRPLPPVALIPVALLLFGFSIATEFFVIVIPCIWPVLVATMSGFASTPKRLRDVARSLRLGRLETIRKILIPTAAPSILIGARLSMSTSLVLAVVVEMIGNPEGLGYALVRESQALDRELMFAYVVLIGGLGVAFNFAIEALGDRVMPGAMSERPAGADS